MPLSPVDANAIFLNIPYDDDFRRLYLAYIVGTCQVGLIPMIASGIPGGERRLDRIFSLIQSCRCSIHDLSRVELSMTPPATPRFNMPLELGLAISWAKVYPKRHTWFLWESEPRRVQKSMSDLDGTDAYIHHGTVVGVLSELRSAFIRNDNPSVSAMMFAYGQLEIDVEKVLDNAGTRNIYSAGVFADLCYLALKAVRPISGSTA